MPSIDPPVSRRAALATLGSAATLSLTGCLDAVYALSAYCQWREVEVGWTYEGEPIRAELLEASGFPTIVEGPITTVGQAEARVPVEFPDIGDGPRNVVVDDETAAALDATFEDVHYQLGFCGDGLDGCLNTWAASRADFNAVQVGDRAHVTVVDGDPDAFHVHSVDEADPAEVAEWETEFSRFDFSEAFADHGVPLAD